MKVKNAASDVIIRELARLQLLCGRTTKRLYTDGVKEESTPDFRNFLKTQETLQPHTAPGFSQSNAVL